MHSPQPSPEPGSQPGASPGCVEGTRMIDLALLLLFATFACGTVAFNGGQGTPALLAKPLFFVALATLLGALILRRRVPG